MEINISKEIGNVKHSLRIKEIKDEHKDLSILDLAGKYDVSYTVKTTEENSTTTAKQVFQKEKAVEIIKTVLGV